MPGVNLRRSAIEGSIVADGRKRAEAATRLRLHAELAAEFAAQLEQATHIWEVWKIRWTMSQEVRRRMRAACSSSESLY